MSGKVIVNVIYKRTTPSGTPLKFDMSYYLNTHIPLAKKSWEPLGLEAMYITEVPEGDIAVMVPTIWRDMDAWKAAAGSEVTQKVVADVPNFCNSGAEMVVGSVVGAVNV